MSNPLILSGDPAAEALLNRAKEEMASLSVKPLLHVVRVGDDPASVSYTRMKARRAKRIGMDSALTELPATTTEAELLEFIGKLNADPGTHGILVQLPFPKESGIREAAILGAINPEKDVDGLHVVNVGRLWSGREGLRPCTPAGIISMLDHYGIDLSGKSVVIVNRSQLVGKPLAALCLERNATVTIAHSRTRDLGAVTRGADLLVTAVGRVGFITPEMVRPGATVIDVSINRVVVDGADKLVGDCDPAVFEVAGAITPVPGGVGPMTVSHLLYNTVLAAKRQIGSVEARGSQLERS
jgi:methylenetetrahydrofolate dehydrogenase (NADP+) / methenyltetrahydrofolate cyclohydrolase